MTDSTPDSSVQSKLRLHLLGSPQVILDGQVVTGFKSVKAQAVLFYIAVSRRPRSRLELASLLWPKVSDKRANTSLRAVLSNLRGLIGNHVEITRHTVSLNSRSSATIDVTQFDVLLKPGIGETPNISQIETAVSLYEGDFLEGFQVPDAPLFEQWVSVEETRLREALLNALQTLAIWHADQSEYHISLDYLARLLTIDPLREVGHLLKMAVLALSGQSGAALNHFHVSRRIRSEELGLDPTPETVALYELILHDQFPGTGYLRISDLIADTLSRPTGAGRSPLSETPMPFGRSSTTSMTSVDWGDMPAEVDFYGRYDQLDQLVDWLSNSHCRLVAILGIGGVGKTALAAESCRRMAGVASGSSPIEKGRRAFKRIIWRSLVNAPPLIAVLDDWLQTLSDRQLSKLPDSLEGKLDLLFHESRRHKFLFVLDNAESILRGKEQAGQTKPGYENYLQLIQQMAEKDHQSCLLLTSREAPRDLRQLSSDYASVEILQLEGLPADDGANLLFSRGLRSLQDRLEVIVEHYSGNPLALKLVADTVLELFGGDIEPFLQDELPIFADIRDVLQEQVDRLPELEREILIWLAIERQPVSAQVLWDDLAYKPHRRQYLEALRSLQHRSLFQQAERLNPGEKPWFALHNVVMEYVTSLLLESVCQELETGKLELLQRHALVKAHTHEYVEQSQRYLLLKPVADWLVARLGSAGAVRLLQGLLKDFRVGGHSKPGYVGANILHLLLEMGEDLRGYDFSGFTIWQADLRNARLENVSFKRADLKGTLFRDTFGLIISIDISPDGQLLAAGSSDGSVLLWGLNEYQPHHILKQQDGVINSVIFSPDGRLLASASTDHSILMWDSRSGQPIQKLSGHTASVFAVAFNLDGTIVFSGGEDQTIRVWDVQTGQVRQQLCHQGINFMTLDTSPNGQILAGGGQSGIVCLWDTNTGELKSAIQGHDGKVRSVAFSPDGAVLATAGEDNKIHLWHTHDGAHISTLTGHDNWVLSVAFSPDGKGLASGSADQTVRLWDVHSARTVRVLRGYRNWVTSVAFSPDGALVAGGSYDRRIRLWDTRSWWLVHTLRGSLRWIDRVTFSPDGRLLASASFDKPLLLWDVQTGSLLKRLRGHSGSLRCIAFSPDGQTLAGGSDDHSIRLWDVGAGDSPITLTDHGAFIRTLAISPDGQYLASGDMDGKLIVWRMSTGGQCYSLSGVQLGLMHSICFSPDGTLLAFGSADHTVKLVNAATGSEHHILIGQKAPVQLVRFSPDGSLVASRANDGAVLIWSVNQPSQTKVQSLHSWSTSDEESWNLVFSPDGRFLAVQIDESSVGLWDLNDGQQRCSIQEVLVGEGCLEFSQSGDFLITGNPDGIVHLWRTATGELYRTLEGHGRSITSLSVSSDGIHFASSSSDGEIRVWNINSGQCVEVMIPPGPYAGMDITDSTGLTPAQVAALQALGAVSD